MVMCTADVFDLQLTAGGGGERYDSGGPGWEELRDAELGSLGQGETWFFMVFVISLFPDSP